MNTKETIVAVANAFNNNNIDEVLALFADDGQWSMLGDNVFTGKEAIKNMYIKHMDMKITTCTMDHIIAAGDSGVIDGYVECTGSDGQMMKMFYCDVYDLENGKVKKMTSYTVDKKE